MLSRSTLTTRNPSPSRETRGGWREGAGGIARVELVGMRKIEKRFGVLGRKMSSNSSTVLVVVTFGLSSGHSAREALKLAKGV
ncbi:hypothetical protein BDY24DRAFT_438091 [Mrakia frigida]|uniref:uncharacterized protein n=1 Tax=Mrakia frigida TaxID=29902 RepID=UPI003FCC04A7